MDVEITRKKFIQISGLAFVSLQVGMVGCRSVGAVEKRIVLSSLEETLKELEKLEKSQKILVPGNWNPNQVLHHCSQSIEYSLTGYPENKNFLIQNTIGKLVKNRFLSQGYMSHNLNDPIPGAPALPNEEPIISGLQRLRLAIQNFLSLKGNPAPHFVYGAASRSEYEKIHAMHVANHLSAFQIS